MPDPGDSSSLGLTGVDRMVLHVQHDAGEWSAFGDVQALIDAARRALAAHKRFGKFDPSEACVALSDDATVRRLNAQYRDKDKATNVLSFPALVPQPVGGEARQLGDVVLAEETLLHEANEQGVPPAHHLQHLVVHGLLHLLGFDHETDAEAEEMEAVEIAVLARMGVANPYADTLAPAGADGGLNRHDR